MCAEGCPSPGVGPDKVLQVVVVHVVHDVVAVGSDQVMVVGDFLLGPKPNHNTKMSIGRPM